MDRGVLGAVMRASRVLGAPCAGAGRPARALRIYSGVLTAVVAGFLFVRTSYIVLVAHGGPLLLLQQARAAGRLLAALLLALAACSAPGRARRAARTLAVLQQIEAELPLHSQGKGSQRKATAFALSSFAVCLAVRVADVFGDVNCFRDVFHALTQVALIFAYCVESSLVLQMILIARRVAHTLRSVNDSLQQLAPDHRSHSSTSVLAREADTAHVIPKVAWQDASSSNANSNRIKLNALKNNIHLTDTRTATYNVNAQSVRRLAGSYSALCGAVRAGGAADARCVLLVLLLCALRLAILLYKIILWGLLIDKLQIDFLTLPLLFCALFLINLVIFTEPFHNTHVEMHRTHFLVTSVKFRRSADARVRSELDLFLRLLRLDRATYSPLGVCTLDRSLTVKIFAAITTYLVVALTYGPELRTPALLVAYTATVGQF